MKITRTLIFILIPIIAIITVTKEDSILKNIELSNDIMISELISKKYSKQELSTIEKLKFNINEYNKEYPIECLREYDNIYKAVYLGEENYLTILFDKSGKKKLAKNYSFSIAVEYFYQLAIGTSIEIVKNNDKNGDYTSYYAGSNESKFSEHYTKDGYYVYILYDDEFKVKDKIIDII